MKRARVLPAVRAILMALLAAVNIMRRYPVDPERVYIGGFSGGSRVALRIVLGYPDVFHGALLEAGSDPIGNADIPLPPVDLLRRLQDATRLVYVTGGRDAVRLDQDVASRKSLQGWCVFDTATQTMPWMGHELADAPAFSRALDALDQHAAPARMTIRRLTARRAPVATILQYV